MSSSVEPADCSQRITLKRLARSSAPKTRCSRSIASGGPAILVAAIGPAMNSPRTSAPASTPPPYRFTPPNPEIRPSESIRSVGGRPAAITPAEPSTACPSIASNAHSPTIWPARFSLGVELRPQDEQQAFVLFELAHAPSPNTSTPADSTTANLTCRPWFRTSSSYLSTPTPTHRVYYPRNVIHISHLIAGEHKGQNAVTGGSAPSSIEIAEPACGSVYASLPDAGPQLVDEAVRAANDAFPAWASAPPEFRSRLMLRLADLIDRDLEPLAQAESRDTGKPIAVARAVDIPRAASNLRFFATAILHTSSDAHITSGDGPAGGQGAGSAGAINYTLRAPRGVAGCISPWNLPLYLFTWKIAPALATGNTVVAKPSEVTPITAWMLGKLAVEAGFPPGVLNIIHGLGDTTGAAIVRHPLVPTITFTGSTKVGAWISKEAGPMFKRLSLELGGKNPLVIFDDADLDSGPESAIPQACRAAFANQGQICLCGSRLLVHERIADRVIDAVVAHAKSLQPGDPADASTRFGSLVSEQHLAKVSSAVDAARASGGTVLAGGSRVTPSQLPERCAYGAFYPPTVIVNVPNSCQAVQEEIFGPVVTIQTFRDDDEAIALSNSTSYGLAASIWTQNISRAHRAAARIDAGIVWVNCWMLRDLRTPFGGCKHSGVGREGGDAALAFFTEPKNVCVRL